MQMESKQAALLNGLALAYMGDGIYEVYVREHLLAAGDTKPNELHRKAKRYVSAENQADVMDWFLAEERLSADEEIYFKRGRNSKSKTKAKNASHRAYSYSTGFEAMIGWLYLTNQLDRLQELVRQCLMWIDEREMRE